MRIYYGTTEVDSWGCPQHHINDNRFPNVAIDALLRKQGAMDTIWRFCRIVPIIFKQTFLLQPVVDSFVHLIYSSYFWMFPLSNARMTMNQISINMKHRLGSYIMFQTLQRRNLIFAAAKISNIIIYWWSTSMCKFFGIAFIRKREKETYRLRDRERQREMHWELEERERQREREREEKRERKIERRTFLLFNVYTLWRNLLVHSLHIK